MSINNEFMEKLAEKYKATIKRGEEVWSQEKDKVTEILSLRGCLKSLEA